MKMKKIFALLLTLVLSAGILTACGNSADEEAAAPAESQSVENAETSAEDTTSEEAGTAAEDTASEETGTAAEETVAPAAVETEPTDDTDAEDTAALNAESNAAEEAIIENTETAETAKPAKLSEYETGTWEGTVYTNEALGIKLVFPETYTIVTGDMLKEYMGQTFDTITENSDDLQNLNQESIISDFMAIAPDQVGNIMLSVEANPTKLTSQEYLDALLYSYEYLGVPYQVIQEQGSQTVGDTDFIMIGLALDYSEITGVEGNTAIQAYMIHAEGELVYYFVATLGQDSASEIGEILDGMQPLE